MRFLRKRNFNNLKEIFKILYLLIKKFKKIIQKEMSSEIIAAK